MNSSAHLQRITTGFAVSAGLSCGALPVAQAAVEEVIVTAQFREERLQDTPLSITALTDDMLRAKSQDSIFQVTQSAPNVQLQPAALAFGPALNAYIRGVGQDDFLLNVEPGVGMYVDDVYHSTLTGTVFELLDLERVEVLRGPQGTLQGRNSIGGAVRLINKKPTGDGTGFVELTYGEFDRVGAKGAADLTVIPETLFVRISAVYDHKEGYQDRLDFACDQPAVAAALGIGNANQGSRDCKLGTLGGKDYAGGRSALRWIPNDRLEVNIAGDFTDDNSEAPAVTVDSAVQSIDPQYGPWFVPRNQFITYESFIDPAGGLPVGAGGAPLLFEPINHFTGWGVSGTIDYQINDWLSVKSITAWREYDARWGSSTDGAPTVYGEYAFNVLEHESLQQEVRLNGTVFDDAVDFTVGFFYYDREADNRARVDIRYLPFLPPGLTLDFISNQLIDSESIAGFGHVVWHVNERLNLTAGLRYSDEEKTQTERRLDSFTLQPSTNPSFADFLAEGGSLTRTFADDRVDYRASIDYRWTDELMTYATFSTGFKNGGANARPFFGSQFVTFDVETVDSFELGFKSDLFDDRLRLNTAFFFNQYEDMQLVPLTCDDISPFPGAPCAAPRNLADADIWGVEVEIYWYPTDNLSIDGSMGYIKNEFQRVDPAAIGPVDPDLDSPENTPNWKANIGAQYEFSLGDYGTLTPRVDVAYEDDKQGLGSADFVIDSYTLVNARLTWRSSDDAWEAALAVTNATDEEYLYNSFDLTGAGAAWTSVQPAWPREWAFTVRRRF